MRALGFYKHLLFFFDALNYNSFSVLYHFSDAGKEAASPSSIKVPHQTELYADIPKTKWPIIYTSEYNIGFLGLEKLHPFDAGKWGRVHTFLKGL